MTPENKIKVRSRYVGEKEPCFIIAEIGSNHDSKLSQARKLIDEAKKAGADCVKFQSFKADELIIGSHPAYKTLKKLELPESWHYKLSDYCKKKKILFTSTPFYLGAVDILKDIDVPFYKISSGDLTYHPLIEKIAPLKRPVFLSTGMAYLKEVKKAVDRIKKHNNNNIVILHCVSIYPPQIEKINLNSLVLLKKELRLPVGLSDHTRSLSVAIAAVAMGACVIERHFTLSRRLKGPDHCFAMEPHEFKIMVDEIRISEKAFGRLQKAPTDEEKKERIFARRGIYAKSDIHKNEIITQDKLSFLRPAVYLKADGLAKILGKKTKCDVEKGTPISFRNIG